jgi:L-iditol 2-dehydrogenase
VIDATGVPSALTEGIQMVRDGGNYVEMGAFVEAGTTTINPNTILHKELNILGSRGTSHVQFGSAVRILEAYKNKAPFHKVVTHKFSLDEIGQAMETAKKLECMKAVVIP